jgi:hypothetical protein
MSLFEITNNIEKNELYMIDLYDINTIIHVVCINKFIFKCDIKIIYLEKDNKINNEYNNSYISYDYEWNFNKIHFRSFSYFDKCRIYKIIPSQ